MIDERARLISEIEDYLEWSRLAASTFGRLAVNNAHLVERLKAGRDVETRTVLKIRKFIATRRRNRWLWEGE